MRVISRGAYMHAIEIDFAAVTDRYSLAARYAGTLTLLVVYGYLVVQLER